MADGVSTSGTGHCVAGRYWRAHYPTTCLQPVCADDAATGGAAQGGLGALPPQGCEVGTAHSTTSNLPRATTPPCLQVYSEKGNLSEVLCKPKIMPIKVRPPIWQGVLS